MKCASCYHDNPPWLDVCPKCGRATYRLRLCSGGHLLPVDEEAQCGSCVSDWPEVAPFSGQPVLRAVMWSPQAPLRWAKDSSAIGVLELRDREKPWSLEVLQTGTILVHDEDLPGASAKVLTRPDGVRLCARPDMTRGGRQPGAALQYEELPPDNSIWLSQIHLRFAKLDVPDWLESWDQKPSDERTTKPSEES